MLYNFLHFFIICKLQPNFESVVHTREEYLEKGPSCCRYNVVNRLV